MKAEHNCSIAGWSAALNHCLGCTKLPAMTTAYDMTDWCCPAHLHDVHVLGLDVVEQPLVVRDHQRCRLVCRQANDGVGDVMERVNVQPCSGCMAWLCTVGDHRIPEGRSCTQVIGVNMQSLQCSVKRVVDAASHLSRSRQGWRRLPSSTASCRICRAAAKDVG